ncbi:GNAT family N-acetyltransferase [bacterium]|nr:GNAT family N-acetyltransferase [bacterium]
MTENDWPFVQAIYEEGIATGHATLEVSVPDWPKWDAEHVEECRLVFRENGTVQGWAALTAVSGRCVYAGVAEVSVYIGNSFKGKGIGKKLLQSLVETSEANGIWTLQAGILKENTASIELHKSCGFREVGVREKLGQLKGVWRDVVLMERRSKVVGV